MKLTKLIALLSFATAASSFGASGIFGTGVVIGVNGTKTLYTTTLLNDGRHAPINVTPPSITHGLPASLGTFDTGVGNTLTLMGGEMLTFKNGTDNVTSTRILYSIDGGSFSSFGLTFNEDNVNGAGGDQRWYGEGAAINLTGLGNGVHTLSVYYEAPFTYTGSPGFGTHVVNNGGSNFSTSFTVVPEPSAALLGGLGVLGLLRRRRN